MAGSYPRWAGGLRGPVSKEAHDYLDQQYREKKLMQKRIDCFKEVNDALYADIVKVIEWACFDDVLELPDFQELEDILGKYRKGVL